MEKLNTTSQTIVDAFAKKHIGVNAIQLDGISALFFNYKQVQHQILGSNPDVSRGTFSRLAENKDLVDRLLRHEDVAKTPFSEAYTDDEAAKKFLKKHKVIVIKPVDGAHGDGVTVGITKERDMLDAHHVASLARGSGRVLMQEHVTGDDIRVLTIDGVVAAAVRREPASVTGDGLKTTAELIHNENLSNSDRGEIPYTKKMCKIDILAAERFLGKRFKMVPRAGETIQVVGTANVGSGGKAIECLDELPAHIKQAALDVANLVGAFICGVDIMYDKSTDRYWLIEINASPSLSLHTMPAEGRAIPVGDIYVERLLERYDSQIETIGTSVSIDFKRYKNLKNIPARVDSGARTSSLWVSNIKVRSNDTISFLLFGPSSPYYTGKRVSIPLLGTRIVTNSTGIEQTRYIVQLSITINKKHINAKFTLSDRATQTYPILIGRNTLRGNFLVDSADPGSLPLFKDVEEVSEYNESELE